MISKPSRYHHLDPDDAFSLRDLWHVLSLVTAKLEELNKQLSGAEANRIVKQAVWQLAKTGDPELISSIAGSSFVQGVGTGGHPAHRMTTSPRRMQKTTDEPST